MRCRRCARGKCAARARRAAVPGEGGRAPGAGRYAWGPGRGPGHRRPQCSPFWRSHICYMCSPFGKKRALRSAVPEPAVWPPSAALGAPGPVPPVGPRPPALRVAHSTPEPRTHARLLQTRRPGRRRDPRTARRDPLGQAARRRHPRHRAAAPPHRRPAGGVPPPLTRQSKFGTPTLVVPLKATGKLRAAGRLPRPRRRMDPLLQHGRRGAGVQAGPRNAPARRRHRQAGAHQGHGWSAQPRLLGGPRAARRCRCVSSLRRRVSF